MELVVFKQVFLHDAYRTVESFLMHLFQICRKI